MKTARLSRRMFLQGAGGALVAIPSMVSLLPRAARAQAEASSPAPRYVQWVTNHGQYPDYFWPGASPNEPVSVGGSEVPDVRIRPLSSISGPLSLVLGTEFDSLRDKFNLIRGIDQINDKNFHNACVPTCCSWPRVDNHLPEFAYSIDAILEKSSTVYPSNVAVPALRLTPGVASSYKWGSFSWTTRNGEPFKLPAYDDTSAALNAVFSGAMPMGQPVGQADRLTDMVIEDYRTVAGSTAISSADRQQLSNYMDLLADLQNRLSAAAPSCSAPQQVGETNFDLLHENATDIAVAALLCGATRVVAYHCYQGSPNSYDEETFHSWAHNDKTKHGQMMIWRYKQLARLLRKMDSFTERDGNTLLDNAVVYANNELSDPGHGSTHLEDMPILLAGGAGGRLTTGNYIDFGNRLLNNVIVTLFNVMGLAPAEFEQDGVVGFGDYVGDFEDRYRAYTTDAEKRKPLPFLYTG